MFSFPDGAFTPVIADYHAIYLDGYTKLYQLLPGRHAVVVAHHHHRQQAQGARPRRAGTAGSVRRKARADPAQRAPQEALVGGLSWAVESGGAVEAGG